MKPKRISARMVKVVWAANIGLVLILALTAGVLWQSGAMAKADFGLAPGGTPTPLMHWTVEPFFLPSVTPNPRGIVVEGASTVGLYGPYSIGLSFSGRPIEVYRFGAGKHERLIVAGIHGGNEWNTVLLAHELIEYLVEHPETIPKDKTLYILPLLNPDGAARAHDRSGRVNDRGVDLNRNWPYRWVDKWDRDGCWNYLPTTGGEYAGSEPETQVLIEFIEAHNFEALISYHSAALGIFAGGVPTLPASDRLARALEKVSHYAYPSMNTGCDYTGNLTDWASSIHGIPAVDIELKNHRDTDFDDNLKILKVFLTWKP